LEDLVPPAALTVIVVGVFLGIYGLILSDMIPPNATCGLQSCNLPITVAVESGKVTPVINGITKGIY